MKHFNIKDYIDDFKTLPLSLVHSFEDPNEQLDTLNNVIMYGTTCTVSQN